MLGSTFRPRDAVPAGFMVMMLAVAAGLLAWQTVAPGAWRGAGVEVDRLTASLGFLVASVGAVTYRFSRRYLDGDPGRRRFLGCLAFTAASAFAVMLADNLLLLLASWTMTSLGLHRLLLHEGDRPEALPPSRKKFLISRLGDVALVAAIAVIAARWETFHLSTFLRALRDPGGADGPALTAVGLLIGLTALTKSAQFPFHSWLPETMEAPTPVSALMHAGIINAGGALLLKFAPAVVRVPEALLMLSAVGSLTLALGMVAMWAQVKVKRILAWSTVAQMGFMMVQCGLGAFPVMGLHMLGHGCYKAWSFLRSGELPAPSRPQAPPNPRRTLLIGAVGTLAAIPSLALAAWLTGLDVAESPGELALAGILALAIGQVWVAIGRNPAGRLAGGRAAATAVVASVGFAIVALALYRGADLFLRPAIGHPVPSAGPLSLAAAAIPVATMVGLIALHAALPVLGRRSLGRAFHGHALNGFYFGTIADRAVSWVWVRISTDEKGVQGE